MEIDWHDPSVTEQVPINQAMAEQMILCLPDSWQVADLSLNFRSPEENAAPALINPETQAGGTVSEDLLEIIQRLEAHRVKFHLPWISAVYSVQRQESSDWKVSASFTANPHSPPTTGQTPPDGPQ